jgi:hypothetical protein
MVGPHQLALGDDVAGHRVEQAGLVQPIAGLEDLIEGVKPEKIPMQTVPLKSLWLCHVE